MTSENKTVFYCDHCRKHYLREHFCARHELYCYRNPANNHACFSCSNLVNQKVEFSYDYYGTYDNIRTRKGFFCRFHPGKELYSYAFERIGRVKQIEDSEPMRMPLECPNINKED